MFLLYWTAPQLLNENWINNLLIWNTSHRAGIWVKIPQSGLDSLNVYKTISLFFISIYTEPESIIETFQILNMYHTDIVFQCRPFFLLEQTPRQRKHYLTCLYSHQNRKEVYLTQSQHLNITFSVLRQWGNAIQLENIKTTGVYNLSGFISRRYLKNATTWNVHRLQFYCVSRPNSCI